jgi:soluble lytic murein transglycosylase-like protein
MVKILIWAFAIIALSACSHTPYVNQKPVVSKKVDLITAVGQKVAKLDKIVPNKPASLKTDVSLSSKNSEIPKLELESDELIEAKRKWNERHIAVESEREQRKKAEKRKQILARKKAEKRKQILARKKAERKRKQILARKKAERKRKQILARKKAERKRKQILARKKAERKRTQILARKKAEKRKQILARKKAKKRKLTLARKKAKKRKLTLARKKAKKRKLTLARKKRLRKKKYKIARSRSSKYYKVNGLYGKQIARAARRTGVDPRLLRSVIKAESNFNPRARSSAGAVGLMQLMPATARRFGVKNRRNAGSNIMGGARYLRYLLKKYRGNKRLAMAAYNAGEGRVRRNGGKVPSYTKRYVNKVLRGYHGSSKKKRSKKKRKYRRKRRSR